MFRRIAIIYNPISHLPGNKEAAGRGDEIRAALAAHDLIPFWYETSKADPGHICARQAALRGADVVMVAGGDGTVMACAKALIGTSLPLAIVPSGTGNVIASSLRLPTNVSDAIEVALHGTRRRIDVGASSPDCVFFAVGIGLTSAMMRDTTPTLKARLGMLAYALNGGRHMLDFPRTFYIWLDDKPPIVRSSLGVIVGNLQVVVNPQCLQASLDDGLLEVGILRSRPLLDWLLHGRLDRSSQRWPPLDWYQASRIKVTCDRLQPSDRDGDWVGSSSLLEVEVLPRSLVVCVPNSTLAGPPQSLSSLFAQDLRKLRLPGLRFPPLRGH